MNFASCPSWQKVVLQTHRRSKLVHRDELGIVDRKVVAPLREADDVGASTAEQVVGRETIRQTGEPGYRPGDRAAQLDLRRRDGESLEAAVPGTVGDALTAEVCRHGKNRPIAQQVVGD